MQTLENNNYVIRNIIYKNSDNSQNVCLSKISMIWDQIS